MREDRIGLEVGLGKQKSFYRISCFMAYLPTYHSRLLLCCQVDSPTTACPGFIGARMVE
jgi:hypothetical protein